MLPGLDNARHVVLPEGIVSSGYPAVQATCGRIGLGHDPWQVGVSQAIFAKAGDGEYAADTVALSVTRQVGKTYLVGSDIFADSIITPGTTTIWTAHRFKVARETFDALASIAKSRLMLPHVDPNDIHSAAGNETIGFRNGSRILFAARERGTVRGVAKVRRLVLDEAQILTHRAMSDMVPTMNQATNPQIILMGTPPKPTDPSEMFTELRQAALDGDAEGLVYIELGADPGSDLDDRDAWRQANPSIPLRTPYKAVLRLRKLLSDEDFAREALGIWDAVGSDLIVDPRTWASLAEPDSAAVGAVGYGIDVSPDRSHASIGMAGWRADGRLLVEFVEGRNSADWVESVAKRIDQAQRPRCWVIDKASPAAVYIEPLRDAGLTVYGTSANEYGVGCGQIYDAAMSGLLVHLDQPTLNVALSKTSKRDIGAEGLFGWNRKKADSDITPWVSVTLAAIGLTADLKIKQPSRLYAF